MAGAGRPDERDSAFEPHVYADAAAFRCALRALLQRSEERAYLAGITPQQYGLLVVVRGHPAYPRVCIGDLATAVRLRQATVSALVERMVALGLLCRVTDPDDRRRVQVGLSAHGQAVLDGVLTGLQEETGLLESDLLTAGLRDFLAGGATSPALPRQVVPK